MYPGHPENGRKLPHWDAKESLGIWHPVSPMNCPAEMIYRRNASKLVCRQSSGSAELWVTHISVGTQSQCNAQDSCKTATIVA